jgi:hypothetical protein
MLMDIKMATLKPSLNETPLYIEYLKEDGSSVSGHSGLIQNLSNNICEFIILTSEPTQEQIGMRLGVNSSAITIVVDDTEKLYHRPFSAVGYSYIILG